METTELERAYEDFLDVAQAGGFGPPPPGQWTAEQVIAHVACADSSIAAVALQVAAGQRPAYDNRPSLDPLNLDRVVAQADGPAGLADLARQRGSLLVAAARSLAPADEAVQIPVFIRSGDELVVDEPWTLGQLIGGIGLFHLPRHADQLRSLRSAIP
jgi:hypothetical protein